MPVLKGGGAERSIINLASNLDRDKYDISIVAGNIAENIQLDTSKNIRIFNLESSGLPTLFIKLIKYLKEEKPDILVSALPHINTISMMAKKFSGVGTLIVLTEHTIISLIPSTARTWVRKIGARFILPHLMGFFYPKADAVICVAKGVMDDLARLVGRLPTMEVIHNPVFDDNIITLSQEPIGQEQNFFNGGKPFIIAVGRLVKAKNYPSLLKAFRIVLKIITADLVILGDGPEEDKLKKMAVDLGVADNVKFLGFKPNPYKYMSRASVFALSSIREGFGNVIVEAMACGAPVVAADYNSGPSEIIEDGVNGLLVDPQNEKALAEAIIKILKDKDLAKILSDNGRARAKYFSVEKSVKEYEKVFERLLVKYNG